MAIARAEASAVRRRQALLVLAVAGILGFRVGYVAFPTWHVAVETAQVVAGLVQYPPGNPLYVYHTKLWTVLHQIGAVLLLLDVSERQLSLLLSGLLGMISLQALAMIVYALSADALLAIGAPFVIFLSRAAENGASYPIALMGTDHTYGAMALSLSVLTIGLLGSGCARAGGLLLGIVPAVHASMGAWLWLTVGIAAAWNGRDTRAHWRPAFKYFAIGAVLTVASLAVQLAFIYDVPAVDSDEARRYLSAFTAFWDGHRRPVSLTSNGVLLNGATLMLGCIWLYRFADDLSPPGILAVRILVVSAVLAFGSVAVSYIPPERLPVSLLTLMPTRLLNINAMVFPACLFGLIGSSRSRPWSAMLLAFYAAGLLLVRDSMFWSTGEPSALAGVRTYLLPLNLMAAVAVLVSLARRFASTNPYVVSGLSRTPQGAGRTGAAAVRGAMLAVLAIALVRTLGMKSTTVLLDRTNQTFFAFIGQSDGLLATAGDYHLIQLMTRRPVLLNSGALDTMSYAPESAPAMYRALKDVYNIDLLHPPADVAPGLGAIPHTFNRPVWDSFSADKWREIRKQYNVTQVLAETTYQLNLPVAAQFRSFKLYNIPEP
jgi:hypothetical protein